MNGRLLGVGLLTAVLVAACGSEPESPRPLPPVSPAASPSASAAPEVPAQARAATPQGAAAFARFWFDALNRAAATGDTAELRALSTSACTACTRFADSIDFLYSQGGIRGGVFSLVAAEAPPIEPGDDEAAVTVVYNVTATEQLAADGSVSKRIEPLNNVSGEMTLRRAGDGWLAAELVTS